jgi:hypothetical protein
VSRGGLELRINWPGISLLIVESKQMELSQLAAAAVSWPQCEASVRSWGHSEERITPQFTQHVVRPTHICTLQPIRVTIYMTRVTHASQRHASQRHVATTCTGVSSIPEQDRDSGAGSTDHSDLSDTKTRTPQTGADLGMLNTSTGPAAKGEDEGWVQR